MYVYHEFKFTYMYPWVMYIYIYFYSLYWEYVVLHCAATCCNMWHIYTNSTANPPSCGLTTYSSLKSTRYIMYVYILHTYGITWKFVARWPWPILQALQAPAEPQPQRPPPHIPPPSVATSVHAVGHCTDGGKVWGGREGGGREIREGIGEMERIDSRIINCFIHFLILLSSSYSTVLTRYYDHLLKRNSRKKKGGA